MTVKTIALASAFVLGSTVFAMADTCSEPIPPASVDGKTATLEQMKAASADVQAFIANSDDYQNCMWTDFDKQKMEAAKKGDKLDPAIEADVRAKTDANQKMKEKVGGEFNEAVGEFNKANPQQ